MKIAIRLMAVAMGLLAAQVAVAQAPAGSTGQCKDGTYTTAASKQGACHGHQGVKEWYAAAASGTSCSGRNSGSGCGTGGEGSGGCSGYSACTCDTCDTVDKGLTGLESCGDATGGGWRPEPGVGEYGQQCLSLLWVDVLRQDEAGGVYVGGRCQGQRRPSGSRARLQQVVVHH